jgi:RNA polymerase sigma-70 factor (ECF subfamily)
MHYPLGQVVWEDFATSLHEARQETRKETLEPPRRKRPLPAREKLFCPVERAFRQWVQRNYGYDPWIFDPRRSDFFQQVYLCAWQGFEQFKGNTEKEFLAWILKILNNELNQIFRKGQQERDFFSDIGLAVRAERPAGTPNLLEEFIRREEGRLVREAFEQLPEEYQQILVFRFENDLAYEEIASRMHRSPDAVRMLCHRARRMLRHLAGGDEVMPD